MKSYHPKSLLNDLQYYITPPHDCSYLEKKSARMVFLDPVHRIDVETLSELSRVKPSRPLPLRVQAVWLHLMQRNTWMV